MLVIVHALYFLPIILPIAISCNNLLQSCLIDSILSVHQVARLSPRNPYQCIVIMFFVILLAGALFFSVSILSMILFRICPSPKPRLSQRSLWSSACGAISWPSSSSCIHSNAAGDCSSSFRPFHCSTQQDPCESLLLYHGIQIVLCDHQLEILSVNPILSFAN